MRGLTAIVIVIASALMSLVETPRLTTVFAAAAPERSAGSPPQRQKPFQRAASAQIIAAAEAYCGGIFSRSVGARTLSPDLVFGRSDGAIESSAPWRQFASVDDVTEASINAVGTEDEAWVWVEEGHVVAVSLIFGKLAAWDDLALYCFRPDGGTAKITSQLMDSNAKLYADRDWIFDTDGLLVKFEEQFFHLGTDKRAKRSEHFVEVDAPLYLRVSDLPFAALLPKLNAQR